MPLSDAAIRNAKPGINPQGVQTTKSYKLGDSGGLYLEVSPAGGKLWRFKYRFDRREKRIPLGKYPEISLAQARSKRDEARKLLAQGVDPIQHKNAQKASRFASAANSFEIIAREWFESRKPSWATSHSKRLIRRLEADVFPWIGSKPITEITPPEILAVTRRIEKRGTLDTAHRIQQDCGQIFRYAVATGRAERDPTVDLRGALPPVIGKHFAALTTPDEVRQFLRSIDAFKGTFVVQCALKLAPMLFTRPGELRQARWEDIDLDAKTWEFQVSKNRTTAAPRTLIVPLAKQAVEILSELHQLTGHTQFVFPGARSNDRAMSDGAINAAIRRLGYDTQTEITGHGFRAMARTILAEELEFPPDVIEHQLAHKVPDRLGAAYNRTKFIKQRTVMMQRWADYLEQLTYSPSPDC